VELHEGSVGEVTVLEVKGRVDSTTAQAFGDRLAGTFQATGQRLVLDLRQLEYISSAGFRMLLLAGKRAEETGSRFVLCGLSGKVRQLFDLGGFLDLFPICGSREEGIAALR
jgi:anti-sigma B factor antagonist/stage II sporulation protein AA (anti-sigma F factor antagonist)